MVRNLRDFLSSIETAYKRSPFGFTLQEFASIRACSNDSPLFSEQVQRYLAGNSKLHERLSIRAMAQERARAQERTRAHQGMGNVHDPLLPQALGKNSRLA